MSREPASERGALPVVGALIKDDRNRVYVHRRSPDRRLLPGTWDIVGGHVERGESPEAALAREIEEETGWRLRRIEAVFAEWEWDVDGTPRREIDYLVELDGDLTAPRLEAGKHDASAWVGPDDLDLLMAGRADGDRRLRDLVARAVRTRLTPRLRLSPLGPWHAGDLWELHGRYSCFSSAMPSGGTGGRPPGRELHYDPAVAAWHAGRYTAAQAAAKAARAARRWEADGTYRWMAYDRADGALVGHGGVSLARVDGADRYEVGWTVRADLWGRGYATEIGAAGLAFAFGDLGADEVVAFTETHNHRSRAVMERLGMRYVRDFPLRGDPFALYEISGEPRHPSRGGRRDGRG